MRDIIKAIYTMNDLLDMDFLNSKERVFVINSEINEAALVLAHTFGRLLDVDFNSKQFIELKEDAEELVKKINGRSDQTLVFTGLENICDKWSYTVYRSQFMEYIHKHNIHAIFIYKGHSVFNCADIFDVGMPMFEDDLLTFNISRNSYKIGRDLPVFFRRSDCGAICGCYEMASVRVKYGIK